MKPSIAELVAILSIMLAQVTSAAETKSVLVFGDSLSDGFMLQRSEAYPALLAKKLQAASRPIREVSW